MWGKVKIELAIWRLALRRAWPQVRAVWASGRLPDGQTLERG
jgi:hypothetical protein